MQKHRFSISKVCVFLFLKLCFMEKRRILGIDPGYANTGFGVIDDLGGEIRLVGYGVIETDNTMEHAKRLLEIFNGIEPSDEKKLFQSKDISIFSELFETEKPVLCDYSGMLIVPQGEMVKYIHGGYLSEFEKYIFIKITDGKVINKGEYSLQEYKEKRDKAFEAFYRSDKYEVYWNEIKNSFVESISDESKKAIMKESEDFYLYDFFEF